ncbi:MAG: SAM-dependent methyltransferase [Alphaproteobacteria bacterium]|nr:SAM-dependent methyltransferase [Alphaproteobacteria bacterium]
MQNTSHAVMAQRIEGRDAPDDFPTPPWATRALLEHVLKHDASFKNKTCLEPACGAGHMARVLAEYFGAVTNSDAYDYGYGQIRDFLTHPFEMRSVDWVITNPPFRLSEEFVLRALTIAKEGVAILARTVFLESVGRYRNLFAQTPPSKFAQFTERVPMLRGRLDRKATTATGYAWLVWELDAASVTPQLVWIPPCRKKLERNGDYPVEASRLMIV